MTLLDWANFYVITGSSAAALIGLQFLLITLIVGTARRANAQTIGAFGTPTIVHFSAAALLSATLSAPWPGLRGPAISLGTVGLAGMVYLVITVVRVRRVTAYRPVLEDWVWHVFLPMIAYLALCVAGLGLRVRPALCLFITGAAILLFLAVGIHNAWDAVAYVAMHPTESSDDLKS